LEKTKTHRRDAEDAEKTQEKQVPSTQHQQPEANSQQLSMPTRHIAAYCFLCLVWSSTWLAIRIVVRDVPPFEAAAFRFLAAAVILLIWALFRRAPFPKPGPQWNATVLLSFTMIAIPYGLLFQAERYVNSSTTAVLFSALPLAVALLTPLMTRRTVPRQALFAMLLAFAGLLTLFYGELSSNVRSLLGGLAIVGAMLSSAWSAVYARKRLHDVDPVVSTGLQMAIGSIGLFWGMWALESHRHAHWTRPAVVALIFLSTFGSAAAFAVYYRLLKHMEPYKISSISMVTPVVAVAEGAAIGDEHIPLMMMAAMALVLVSVAAVLRADARGEEVLSVSSN